MSVNRSDLIKHLATSAAISVREAETVLAVVLEEICDSLASGGRVELRGFGAFSIREQAARLARNPRSGATVDMPAKKRVHFKPGRRILKALNGDAETLLARQAAREEQRRRQSERSGQLWLF